MASDAKVRPRGGVPRATAAAWPPRDPVRAGRAGGRQAADTDTGQLACREPNERQYDSFASEGGDYHVWGASRQWRPKVWLLPGDGGHGRSSCVVQAGGGDARALPPARPSARPRPPGASASASVCGFNGTVCVKPHGPQPGSFSSDSAVSVPGLLCCTSICSSTFQPLLLKLIFFSILSLSPFSLPLGVGLLREVSVW